MDYIKTWPFDKAPKKLRALSNNGGDEDWVSLVPKKYKDIPWMDSGSAYGCFCVDVYEHEDYKNHYITIGCHA